MSFFLPSERTDVADPREVYGRLLKLPEFAHLTEAEARVEWLFRTHEEVRGGRRVLGTVYRPDVQGRLREVFQWLLDDKFGGVGDEERGIDFLIVLDAEFWLDAGEREREILVYHELCHIQPAFDRFGAQRFDKATGLPILTLVGHDVEEFSAVVRKYGAYSGELRDFIAAAAAGGEFQGGA